MDEGYIYLNLDTVKYYDKETSKKYIGAIRNRLCDKDKVHKITIADLQDAIEHGRSFTPSVMYGTSGSDWKAQILICADIDNDKADKTCIDNPLTIDQSLSLMKQYNIEPIIIYKTFSFKEDHPKYRIILLLDDYIKDRTKAESITNKFINIFQMERPGCIDRSTYDNARLFLGGKKDSVVYSSKSITNINLLEALPNPADVDSEDDKGLKQNNNSISDNKQHNITSNKQYRIDELEEQLKRDKENFDLLDYIKRTTSSKIIQKGSKFFVNPCPVCNHNDDFQVTGNVWCCFSANGLNGKGGTIIDYLMHAENLSKAKAIDKFQFEIMNYDRDEWNKAYYDKQNDIEGNRTDTEDAATSDKYMLPPIRTYNQICENPKELPPELIGGILRKGGKMCITGSSKAGKSIILEELAFSLAEGRKWLDYFYCTTSKVLYINLEINDAICEDRFNNISDKLQWALKHSDKLGILHMRGKLPTDINIFIDELINQIKDDAYEVIIIDPIYKIIEGDENNSEEIKKFTNRIDRICEECNCSVIYSHHHTKGSQANKDIIDRASGSGVFARDVDALIDITKAQLSLEMKDKLPSDKSIWEFNAVVRAFKSIDQKYLWFNYPLHTIDKNGEAVKYVEKPTTKRKTKQKQSPYIEVTDEIEVPFENKTYRV